MWGIKIPGYIAPGAFIREALGENYDIKVGDLVDFKIHYIYITQQSSGSYGVPSNHSSSTDTKRGVILNTPESHYIKNSHSTGSFGLYNKQYNRYEIKCFKDKDQKLYYVAIENITKVL